MYITTSELRKIRASVGFDLHISVNLGKPLEERNDDLLLFRISEKEVEEFDDHYNKNIVRKIIHCELLDEEFYLGEKNYFEFYEDMNLKNDFIFLNIDGELEKLILFDEKGVPYKLKPTDSWPTLMIGPTPMHRSKEVTVKQDTELKLKFIEPIEGKCLDTCFGAGYTALLLSKKAEEVFTFEVNENVLELASLNPFTQELFDNSQVHIENESIIMGIVEFKDNFFDRVIHDPPTGPTFGDLYSVPFYRELYRVMKKGAKLYHYVPRPGIKSGKDNLFEKVKTRLIEAGFTNVEYKSETSGIICSKE